ncbi:MAG TPA: hypothetical protein VMW56_10535 [Candidatus Margulisiibacteriota bacterium]|nr:hypothetical protein [Candidatus Margulisiibacteriota bacterium]
MGYVDLAIAAGVDIEKTPLLNQGRWSSCSGIRFFEGLVQKRGGFTALISTPVVGIARGMHGWGDSEGNPYIAIGTNSRLQLYNGSIQDITPIRLTRTGLANTTFQCNLNSNVIQVNDVGHGLLAGDWIQLVTPVSIGPVGLAINIPAGFYQVQTVPSGSLYTFFAPTTAPTTSTAGATPNYITTAASSHVTVNLNAHGLGAGQTWQVHFPTTVDGITVAAGYYPILSVTDANNFVIDAGTVAGFGTSAYENGDTFYLNYLIPSGASSPGTSISYAYGVGPYGVNNYGYAGTSVIPLRQWFLDNFGQDLIGTYTLGPVVIWQPPLSTNPVAQVLNTTNFPGASQPPQTVIASFMSAQQLQLICLGCDTPGTGVFNPLLVRWCDSEDFTAWQALSTNLAGSYPIPSGSRLVGGISAANFNAIFTDVDMWIMNYLGGTGLAGDVWGFNRIAGSRGLLSARSVGLLASTIFYPSPNGFFSFNGGTSRPIKCEVWDFFWQNINLSQVDKVHVTINSQFQELTWHFPSLSGAGECDSSVTYHMAEGVWSYETESLWARTTGIDQNVYGAPVAVDLNGLLEQYEQGYDANGQPISVFAQTGWFAIDSGNLAMMLERLESDLKVSGGNQTVYVTIYAQDFPNDPNIRTFGPFPWVPGSAATMFSIVRARGRFMALRIASSDASVFWRLGRMRYFVKKAGSRYA